MRKKRILPLSRRLQIKLLVIILLLVSLFTVILLSYSVLATRIALQKQTKVFGNSLSKGLSLSFGHFLAGKNIEDGLKSFSNVIRSIGASYDIVRSIDVYLYDVLVAKYSAIDFDNKDPNKVIGERGIEFTSPIIVRDKDSMQKKKIGYVKIIIHRNSLFQSYLNEIREALPYSVILLFVISGILFLVMDKIILSPIRIIENGTRIIADGDLKHKIIVSNNDEIGVLADAFNEMTDKLRESKEKIEAWNRMLEDKVRERTAMLEASNKELKRAQYELIQSGKMATIGFLGAGVAHELNNPLVGIIGYIQLILMKLKKGGISETEYPSIIKNLGYVESEAQRCKRIVDELLHFSRKSKGDFSPVDINHTISLTLSVMEYQIRKWKIEVVDKLAKNPVVIAGDEDKLQQVFINLIANAHHAMPDGGTITFETYVDTANREAVIKISDSGCGIPKEKIDKIFSSFFSEKRDKNNLGLGLSITQQIIKMHKGNIEAESAVGRGTTFILKLPIARKEDIK